MKKDTLLVVGITLIVGILVGILVAKSGDDRGPSGRQASAPPSAPPVDTTQNARILEEMVAKDPANRNAWVQLGNLYFDSKQPVKAVEAYSKALELKPDDPNVLTDQGIMFRQLGWYDRAIENFTKANEIAPSHFQSLYNLGIVYRYDLQDFAKAKEAWSRYLELNPVGPGPDQIRAELEFLESHPAIPQGG